MEIIEINSQNDKKITYEELNDYLTKFNKYIQNNKNKLLSFFDVESEIKTNLKLEDFVFLNKNKIMGNLNSMTFFENINSWEFINMINFMPKYFILVFDKFLSKYHSQNNPFKLIYREWENLSKEIFIYYSMIRTFKKIEKNTSEIILKKNKIYKILSIKNNLWFYFCKKNDKESLSQNMIQNMFFQIFYLYKKSKNHKYLTMFILSCSVIIEMLNKHKKEICKHKNKCKKNFYSCEYLDLFNDEEKEICKKIIIYRDSNSLTHNNFDKTENIVFNINFNRNDLFQISKKILEFIHNI